VRPAATTGNRPGPATIPPFTVLRIDHLVLRVRELRRSVAFYEAAFGCAVVRWRDDLGLVHLRAGSSMIDLVAVDGVLGRRGGAPPDRVGRNLDHFCIRIEPFDEPVLIAHLATLGVVPKGSASLNFGAEGEGMSLYVEDLDGNVIELKGPVREP
jgi:catechol 2,3-dioxygenase-like lactoylglutathione lyase family enzyme